MAHLLLMAALACGSGERLLDLRGKVPLTLKMLDLVISVSPFYSRIYIYPLGSPDDFEPCCGNKPTSILRLPIGNAQFCIRQSQPQMKWQIRGLLQPEISL